MRKRFVIATREQRKDALGCPRTTLFYKPVELRNGNLYSLDASGERGHEHPADAWKAIDEIEARERHPERCDCEKCRPELYAKGG